MHLRTYETTAEKIKMLEWILYEEAFNLFGVTKKQMKIRKPSRRLIQRKYVRNKIKDLAKAMKCCSDENEYGALVCFTDELKKRRRVLRSAEHSRKIRCCRKQLQKCFFKGPFKTAKEVILTKLKSETKVPKSVLNEFIKKVDEDLDSTSWGLGLDDISVNIGKFNAEKFKISDLSQVIKKKRNGSQLGPNEIPYKIYQKCPRVMNNISRIMLIAVRDKVIPLSWCVSNEIMMPKVQNSRQSSLADYSQVALGNVEGKLFWSLIAQRFYQHLATKNNLIDSTS